MENRNVWCFRYSECLDTAVKTAKLFDCSGCAHFFNEGGRGEVSDMIGECRLIAAIFRPEYYEQYLEDMKKDFFRKQVL